MSSKNLYREMMIAGSFHAIPDIKSKNWDQKR